MKSELFSGLSDIEFAQRDPAIIEREVIGLYERLSGRTLARGDPVRIMLEAVVLAIIHQRNLIDIAGKNNHLAYAEGAYLDHLGALLGVYRLSAGKSVCRVRFTLKDTHIVDIDIPEGTRISPDGRVIFEVASECIIPAGELIGECDCASVEAGSASNGYIAGQINQIMDTFPWEMDCENITESSGGSDQENDENFRERIMLAPESFSSAGPKSAYEYYARSADPDIMDVSVVGPPDIAPGNVNIYPLMREGLLPDDDVLDRVLAACSADDVRPDTDYVHVLKPEAVYYQIEMTYWVDAKDSAMVTSLQGKVMDSVNEYIKWQRNSLGRDINPSELISRVVGAGAKRCEVRQPEFRVLSKSQVAWINRTSVQYGGLEEG